VDDRIENKFLDMKMYYGLCN